MRPHTWVQFGDPDGTSQKQKSFKFVKFSEYEYLCIIINLLWNSFDTIDYFNNSPKYRTTRLTVKEFIVETRCHGGDARTHWAIVKLKIWNSKAKLFHSSEIILFLFRIQDGSGRCKASVLDSNKVTWPKSCLTSWTWPVVSWASKLEITIKWCKSM